MFAYTRPVSGRPRKMNTTKHNETASAAPDKPARVHTVADIPEHFTLLQDSQDIHATLESCGLLTYESETGCLFAEVLDGDYGSIYMCTRAVPWLAARVYQLQ